MPRFGADPFYTGRDDPALVDVPFGTETASSFNQMLDENTSMLLADASRLRAETTGRQQSSASLVRFGRLPGQTVVPSETVSAEDAKARIEGEGLAGHLTVPKTGIPSRALDILIEHKNTELRNQYLQDRYRGGFAGGSVQLGVKLAAAMVDPLNIASAFVPVIGEARYAALLERAGTSLLARGAVRASAGAAEGMVGQAMLEPANYFSKQQLQQDYTTDDALRNVAFGGLFGGTLHVGAGGVSDLLAKSAGLGAWAETINPDGSRHLPDLPAGAIGGGGTHFVDGLDRVRGQYAVVEASSLPGSDRAKVSTLGEYLETGQLGHSPYADSGAPVLRADGSVVNGSRRLATISEAYGKDGAEAYRAGLVAEAERYGLDGEQVKGMAQPVLVRVEGSREVGAWGEFLKAAEDHPANRVAPESVLTPEQHANALRIGVAQAVNDLPVDVSSAAHLDGSRGGVERFLADRKAADEDAARRLTEQQAQFDRAVNHADNIDPADAPALTAHVKELETDLRAQIKAAGHDPAELDAALDADNLHAEELAVDAKAYQAIGLCMQRAA